MLCKKETDEGERDEYEMELVSILDNSSDAVETIEGKLSGLNEKSDSRVSKMQDKLERIKH